MEKATGIPKSFLLGGHKITVTTISAKKWPYGDGVVGMWTPSELKIEIHGGLKGTHKQACFVHEATHAMLDVMGYHELSADEDFVERFSVALHQMLTTQK